MKIRILEKVKAFPFNGYRNLCLYPDVDIITAENHSGIDYFCLHLHDGRTATYNTIDYIMEFQ